MVVVNHAIFDESLPDAFFIHRWANYLHINTRDFVVLNKLPFKEGERITQKDLDEVQRLLRAEPYFRDARLSFTPKDPTVAGLPTEQAVLIETWDNWSLLPTINFSSNGGESKYSVGMKEDNLLGLGVRTLVKYQSDAERSGYQFAFEAPLNVIPYSTLSADFHDNSDGQATHVRFLKPFHTLDSRDLYGVEFLDGRRIDTLKQNGKDINEFEHAIDYLNLSYGRLLSKENAHLSRFILGATRDKHEFDNIADYPDSPLPRDRDFLYPWLAYEYLNDDFRVLNNVHLISTNEDFNLGWHHYVQLGLELQDTKDGLPGLHLDWRTQRGYQDKQELLLLEFLGSALFNTRQKDFYNLSVQAEYFYHIGPKWTAYSKARLSSSRHNFLDNTFALGDETGVRGYPNDYQHGDNQWLFTQELRYYPNINLYQFAELGWAAFIDVGQALGGPDDNNETSGPIGSLGIGARLYSSHSSYGNVAHIDLTFPFTQGDEVNGWGWRVLVRTRF
ncbi:hypothetical protein HC757_07970 [Shewanella sp. SHSM-M6]|uniref:Haemolysin activator HlyB C-terminal domain-containing protein n=1 Tax=Shewanella salipaludis TaxID=2723052 RepID=A0A972JIJ6_9GAMM|nr:hypothetical protein [Shewanella salipaludis]